jgi:hypothetical protein
VVPAPKSFIVPQLELGRANGLKEAYPEASLTEPPATVLERNHAHPTISRRPSL